MADWQTGRPAAAPAPKVQFTGMSTHNGNGDEGGIRTRNGPNPSQLYNQTGNSTTAAGALQFRDHLDAGATRGAMTLFPRVRVYVCCARVS